MKSLEQYAEKLDFRGLVISSIITALSFVVGLFWKDAIQITIDLYFKPGEGLLYIYIAAIIITIAVAVIAFLLIRSQNITIKKLMASEHINKIKFMNMEDRIKWFKKMKYANIIDDIANERFDTKPKKSAKKTKGKSN